MNAPYLLIPLSLILLILYGISYLYFRLGIISRTLHRRIWNYALLATFLTAAILGILMAVQINYRMKVPWTEIVLKWHVNFGIAMSVVGIFHLLWHLGYYLPAKHPHRIKAIPVTPLTSLTPVTPVTSALLPFVVGFTGIAFQTFMIRELLGLFHGNELMLSIIMFIWLLVTGAGAMAGNSANPEQTEQRPMLKPRAWWLAGSLVVIPLLLIPLVYYCRSLFFAPGIEAGPLAFSGFTLLFLLPFCFVNGFAFTYITRLLKDTGLNIRKAYAWESAGGATAGFLCTAAVIAGMFTIPAGRAAEKLFHPNDEILATRSGPAGRLTITANGGQCNIFENGVLMQSSGNSLVCQEMAHFAMIQHPAPSNVLVIGGLLSGIDAVLAGYHCSHVDFIEPDPSLIRMAGKLKLTGSTDPPFRHIRVPAERWIRRSDIRYDVVLIMLPGPQTLGLNRFYTAGFYSFLKSAMTGAGVVSVLLPGTANYVSDEAVKAIGPITNAIRKSFTEAAIFPGENSYLIAAGHELRTDIPEQLAVRHISASYIEGYYDEQQFVTRMNLVNKAMEGEAAINSVLRPASYLGQIAWWLGKFPKAGIWPLGAVFLLILLAGFFPGHRKGSAMFLMGAGTSGLQIILLFLLQMSAGSIYLLAGILMASFMAGLSAGSSGFVRKLSGKTGRSPGKVLLLFCIATALAAPVALWISVPGTWLVLKTLLIVLLSFVSAMLSGMFFAGQADSSMDTKTGGLLYVFDLAGGACGALVYPMVIIPVFGLLPAIGIISGSGMLILIIINANRK